LEQDVHRQLQAVYGIMPGASDAIPSKLR